MELTKDSAYKALQAIFKKKILLIIGTGASCILDRRFGMPALAEELKAKVPSKLSGNNEAEKQWKTVETRLDKKKDLESSLNGIDNEFLLETIIRVTVNFVAMVDKENKLKIMNGEIPPLEKIIKAVKEGLPESDPVLDIITSNYDLLIEHTCDKLKIPYCTGFVGGIQKYYDWDRATKEMIYIKPFIKSKKVQEVKRIRKHIRLHKVHGSINWFRKDNSYLEDNSLLCSENITGIKRWIITPGDTKYREAFIHNREIFAHADEVIPGVKAYIFVGYGFNDEQIEKKIKYELIENEKPGIIITKGLSSNAEKLLGKAKNLWAVYQDQDIKNSPHSCIENGQYEKPFKVENSRIWQIDMFMKEIISGE